MLVATEKLFDSEAKNKLEHFIFLTGVEGKSNHQGVNLVRLSGGHFARVVHSHAEMLMSK